MDTNPYEVVEQDYKLLEDIFREKFSSAPALAGGDLLVQEELETFIIDVGNSVKGILQKYADGTRLSKLEMLDCRAEMLSAKRKSVKMALRLNPLERAIQAFNNVKKED